VSFTLRSAFNPDTWLEGDTDTANILWDHCGGQYFFAFGM